MIVVVIFSGVRSISKMCVCRRGITVSPLPTLIDLYIDDEPLMQNPGANQGFYKGGGCGTGVILADSM